MACRIPSSIKVFATSVTLVPCVPCLESFSKYSHVATARVIGRRSVSAMRRHYHDRRINEILFRLKNESELIIR